MEITYIREWAGGKLDYMLLGPVSGRARVPEAKMGEKA